MNAQGFEEERLRALMGATTLEPPLRPDLVDRVRVAARRRTRRQQLAGALCLVLAGAAGAGLAASWHSGSQHGQAISGNVSCAGTVVTASAGTQHAVLPGHGSQELTVRLGESVRFDAVGPCAARIGLLGTSDNLVGRSVSFPPAGGFVADAAKLGTETAQVTVSNCPAPGRPASCGDAVVVGMLTVRIVSSPTP